MLGPQRLLPDADSKANCGFTTGPIESFHQSNAVMVFTDWTLLLYKICWFVAAAVAVVVVVVSFSYFVF